MISSRALRMAAVAAALTAGAATAAQAQSPIKFGIAAGAAVPVSDVADAYETGYNGTVTLALKAPLFPVGLRVDGMFNRMAGKEDEVLGDAFDLDVSSVNANLTYNLIPLPVASVYLIGGAGYYRAEFRDSGVDAENKVGYNGGVGVRLGMGTQLFVEGRYHRVNLGDDVKLEFVPVTIGFMF
jgi:opacity protein-like surface antigen